MLNRENLQKKIIKDTLSILNKKQSKIIFSEIKTGTGKTKILLETAFKRLKKTGKAVIISTSNNYLAIEYLKEAEKFGFNKDKIAILIGKDNYLNKNMIDKEFYEDFKLKKKDVRKWLQKHLNYPLISLFLDDFNLPEEAEWRLKREEEDEATISTKALNVVNKPMIYVTNHYYLLFLLKYANSESFYELDIFADEVHLLNNAARNLFKKSFSPYRLKFLLKRAVEQEKKYANKYKQLISITDELLNNCKVYANQNLSDSTINELKEILNKYTKSDIYQSVKKTLLELSNKKKNKDIQAVLNEIFEADTISIKNNYIEVSFSPIKGNITFQINDDNPISKLKGLMANHTGNFWGVSGTIRVSPNNSIQENKWAFERIGFSKYKAPEQTAKHLIFNAKILNMHFNVYNSIYKRTQAIFYVAKKDKYHPVKDLKAKNSKKEYLKWIKNLADLVKNTFWENGLILMSSYENVELMKEALIKNGFSKKYKIFANTIGTNLRKLIKEYKESVDSNQPSVLIGGLNLYTGLDLPGEYLKTLFIGKIPIEARGDFFYRRRFGSFSSQEDMRKNALLTFRQGIGRAIRSEKDRVFIVIADPRIETPRYIIFKNFLKEMAIEAHKEDEIV